jgi:hypothetical protein
MCDLVSHLYYVAKAGTQTLSTQSKSRNEEIEKMAFLELLRGNKLQLRRVLRTEINSVNDCVTLLQLQNIFKKYGVNVTEKNKILLSKLYSIPSRDAALMLSELNTPFKVSEENVDQNKISGTSSGTNVEAPFSRLDIKSSSRLISSLPLGGAQALSDIQCRRQQLAQSVLKPATIVVSTTPSIDMPQMNEDATIVISFKGLSDDIYRSDWL